jgi:predicted TIM-barrel fold metal-dependent hydrolase
METNITSGFVSADGHVVEPADLWTSRVDKRFRDRAPRVESRPEGDFFVIEGMPPFPVGLEGAMMNDKIAGEIKKFEGRRYSDTRPGAWDPQARLSDQDLDHVRAEIVYPGIGLIAFGLPDHELKRACMQVYNDWLGEFCSTAPDRLLGAGLLPVGGPVEWAIEEAQRMAKKGMSTVSIPATVPDRPYFFPDYEPLWAALQELGLPVSIHVGTGKIPLFELFDRTAMIEAMGVDVVYAKIGMLMRTMAELIWGGVPQRYPKLRFVLAEGGIGWIAAQLRFMDHWWTDHHRWMASQLDEPPSVYFHRQFWATFEDDRPGLLTRELLNVEHLMWGADYPHTEGTFPHSQEAIAKDFAGIPEVEVYKMVTDNAAHLYGLTLS